MISKEIFLEDVDTEGIVYDSDFRKFIFQLSNSFKAYAKEI